MIIQRTAGATREKGFSLIELMIVVAIIAILAGIAYPSYQNSLLKSRRADAKAALSAAVMAQERAYFQNSSYATSVNDIGGTSGTLLSPEGYYSISINNNSGTGTCVGGGTVKYNCYTLTATPVAGGPQAGDSACTTLSITHTGVTSSTPVGSDCW